jgi:hypothetical protein
MGADITRDTFDEAQNYRQLVLQQGRVTVDADLNEAQMILREETRKEALDFVGPAGSPDDGFMVGQPAPGQPFDFSLAAGSLYVGGLRVSLAAPTSYSTQTDWLDKPALNVTAGARREAVLLHLIEQEVSAVEDSAQLEVALGGPDSAQRVRLLQRFEPRVVTGPDCSAAFAQVLAVLDKIGFDFDATTMRLLPKARLQVSFKNPPTAANQCEPSAQGGYLEAANQLIRVQVATAETILWGFDDASSLYRVDVLSIDPVKLEARLRLQAPPVDEEHLPRSGWAYEVLLSTAQLANGEYVAAGSGKVGRLKGAYDPDTQTLTLSINLPQTLQTGSGLPPVFLRVWEDELSVQVNKPLDLGTTGVQVTFSSGPRHPGEFWRFAVRPSTPVEVYPDRYLKAAQPPDGPREWLCPLAVLDWVAGGASASIQNCRPLFDNLVELTRRKPGGGCCTITLGPKDLGQDTLQTILDRFRKSAATVCLMPGNYDLPAPLRLTEEHSQLTLEACQPGVVLRAADGKEPLFLDGLVVLTGAKSVAFRNLTFQLPIASFSKAKGRFAGLDPVELFNVTGPDVRELSGSIGLRVLECTDVVVRGCTFQFDTEGPGNLFAAGILVAGDCVGLNVSDCRFERQVDADPGVREPYRFRIGIASAPAFFCTEKPDLTDNVSFKGLVLVPTGLDRVVLRGNQFTGLTIASLIYGVNGAVQAEGNLVRRCTAGLWALSMRSLAFFTEAAEKWKATGQEKASNLAKVIAERSAVVLLGSVLARCYPLPATFKPSSPPLKLSSLGVPMAANGTLRARFTFLLQLLSAFEKNLKADQTNPTNRRLCLQVMHNDIACQGPRTTTPDNAPSPATTGLLVWDDVDPEPGVSLGGTVLVSSNRILEDNQTPFPAAVLLMVERCTVTGNIITNERIVPPPQTPPPVVPVRPTAAITPAFTLVVFSLVMAPASITKDQPGRAVAITGNVFLAAPILPPRFAEAAPLTAPLNGWEFLNTVIPNL